MAKKKEQFIEVDGNPIKVKNIGKESFFCLTDIAKTANSNKPDTIIGNWLRNKDTIEFLTVWELSNQSNYFNFDAAKALSQVAGGNAFTLSVKEWTKQTGAEGIYAKAGRYGGTYAHEEIALGFCSWINPVFHLYFIKEFKRLKLEEAKRMGISWDHNIKRFFSKANFHILTDAVKSKLIPQRIIQNKQEWIVYASEADLLNQALFGVSAKEWRAKNPDLKGNMRDYATPEQLLVLANLENLNAEYIHLGLDKEERLKRLNEVAIHQMELFLQMPSIRQQLDKFDN